MPIFSSLAGISSPTHKTSQSIQVAFTVAAGLAALTAAYQAIRRVTNTKKCSGFKRIPEPTGAFPYIGHLLVLDNHDVGAQFTRWQDELGPVMQVRLGVKNWIIISDPAIAYELFCTNGSVASSRPTDTFAFKHYSMGGRGVLMGNSGKRWRETRKAVHTILAPASVETFMPILQKEAEYLVENLSTGGDSPRGINPRQTLKLFAMNGMLVSCFGERAASVNEDLFRDVQDTAVGLFDKGGIHADLECLLPAFKWIDRLTRRKNHLHHLVVKRNKLIGGLIREALDSNKNCLARHLYDIREVHGLDDDDVLVTASDMVIAATDTTSVTLEWLFALLIRYPHVQERIQAEIDGFAKENDGRTPAFADRDKLPYLIAVQKEGMRFRSPSVAGVPHIVDQDVECHGYIIPKGSFACPNVLAMHQDPDLYPDPDQFIPERFLKNSVPMSVAAAGRLENRDHYSFGWGRRLCPGIYITEAEMFLAVVSVLSQFSLEPPLDADNVPVYPDIDTRVSGGLVVSPLPFNIRFMPRMHSPAVQQQ